ncbi:hypothetical protein C8J56DRAFT_903972 [Mycena floridula]|nr:hypothetical protein C8J56DRAFT_903972 [Mycena floridula]
MSHSSDRAVRILPPVHRREIPSTSQYRRMKQVRSVVRLDSITQERCYLSVDDSVAIVSPIGRHHYWFGKLTEIRLARNGQHFARFNWYYSADDLDETNHVALKRLANNMAPNELALSNHTDIQPVDVIEYLLSPTRTARMGKDDWYTRYSVDVIAGTFSPLIDAGHVSLCLSHDRCDTEYNPKSGNQRFCGGCEIWYHEACCTEVEGMDEWALPRDQNDVQALARVPIIRGEICLADLNVCGTGPQIVLARGWDHTKSVPPNWRDQLGKEFFTWWKKRHSWVYKYYRCPKAGCGKFL